MVTLTENPTKAKKVKAPKAPKQPKQPKSKKSKKGEEPADDGAYAWPSPAKPSALMVPKYVRENRAADRSRRHVVLGVGAAGLVGVLAVAGSFFLNQSSTTALVEAEGAQNAAQEQVDRLQPVATYYDGLETRRQATSTALASDIRHADLLTAVLKAVPGGVEVKSYSTSVGAPCVGPDPFAAAGGLGCINFTGSARSEAQVAQVIAALDTTGEEAPLLTDPFVSSINSDGDESVEFTVSVNFTDQALSLRYVTQATDTGQATEDATQDLTQTDGTTEDGTP